MNIVLVEPDASSISVAHGLRIVGKHDVHVVGRIQAALEVLRHPDASWDALLTDCGERSVNALQLVDILVDMRKLPRIVLFMTTNPRDPLVLEARERFVRRKIVQAVLEKPFDLRELLSFLHT